MKTILKVIVGSRAHGLATEKSDWDYRGVFITPTSEIVGLKENHKTNWTEGEVEDSTMWELGHFLRLATHCNPTILETFLAPIVVPNVDTDESLMPTPEGLELRALFPKIWNSKAVHDAFIGYGLNQRKKFLDKKDKRPEKYAVAYLRTLYQAYQLLTYNTFSVDMRESPIYKTLWDWKNTKREDVFALEGEVIATCAEWKAKVDEAYEKNPNKEADLEAVNEYLLRVRKANW